MSKVKILYINSPKYDLITALHIEGLLKLKDVEIKFTSLGNYAPKKHILDYRDSIDFGKKADIVIIGSRYVCDLTFNNAKKIQKKKDVDSFLLTQAKDILLFWKIKSSNLLRIKIEGGDNSALGTDVFEYFKYDIIFKREMFIQSWSLKSLLYSLIRFKPSLWRNLKSHILIPFPNYHSMGNNSNFLNHLRNLIRNLIWLPYKKKVKIFNLGIEDRMIGSYNQFPQYELCCIMRAHTRDRIKFIDFLKSKKYPKMFLDYIPATDMDMQSMIDNGAAHPNFIKMKGIGFSNNKRYLNQINNSRASVSIPGGGFDTLRFWEILAQGSLLISKRVSLQMKNPLREGVHYLAFDTLDELNNIIEWIYKNPDKVDEIRKSGHEFALKNHTSKARAEYFLNEVKLFLQ